MWEERRCISSQKTKEFQFYTPRLTHPRPLPGQTRWRLSLVKEGLVCGGEQRILEERSSTEAGPPQLVKTLALEVIHSFWHPGWASEALKEGGKQMRKGREGQRTYCKKLELCTAKVVQGYARSMLTGQSYNCWGLLCFLCIIVVEILLN